MKIGFFKAENGNWIDFIIAKWTGFGKYSHCFILDDTMEYSTSGFHNGVYTKQYLGPDECYDFIDLDEIVNVVAIKKIPNFDFLYKFYNSTKNTKYDWVGIFFKFFFNKNIPNKKFYCSEWCSLVIQGIFNNELIFLDVHGSPNRLFKQLNNFLKK